MEIGSMTSDRRMCLVYSQSITSQDYCSGWRCNCFSGRCCWRMLLHNDFTDFALMIIVAQKINFSWKNPPKNYYRVLRNNLRWLLSCVSLHIGDVLPKGRITTVLCNNHTTVYLLRLRELRYFYEPESLRDFVSRAQRVQLREWSEEYRI